MKPYTRVLYCFGRQNIYLTSLNWESGIFSAKRRCEYFCTPTV